jgi:hypothetical protein
MGWSASLIALAADLELVLNTENAIMTNRDELQAAVARLKAAIE